MRKLGALVAFILCTACPPPIAWVPADPTFVAPNAGFAVQLPAGWMRLADGNRPDDLLITRDGTPVGKILVTSDEPGNTFIYGDSKLQITPAMSPQDVAEAVVDGLTSTGVGAGVKVTENAPATLAGRKGFKVVATYKNGDGLRMGIAVYGVVIPTGVYYLVLQAPERVYFARHLPAFDKLAASFQLRPDAKGVKWPHEEEGDEEKGKTPEPPKNEPSAPSAYKG
jgi:hypothetical protein